MFRWVGNTARLDGFSRGVSLLRQRSTPEYRQVEDKLETKREKDTCRKVGIDWS